MSNLYLPVYKNLEKEVLELSYNVYFDDTQFEYIRDDKENYIKTPPYSLKIGDLLIRCCTEIEALIQELTRGKDEEIRRIPSVDRSRAITTGCRLKYLHHVWGLDKKVVLVSCSNMFFQNEDNKSFIPFAYNKEDDNDYYSAYNSIKHDRSAKTIYKGNIRFLLRALAALYLLNIYHKDESIFLEKNSTTSSVPSTSNIFSVETIIATTEADNIVTIPLGNFQATASAVFMVKATKESVEKNRKAIDEYSKLVNKKQIELLQQGQIEVLEKAIRSVPNNEIIKALENMEYEAVTIKPEKIRFYRSQGCISKYTEEQLKEIEKDVNLWKCYS